MENELRFSDRQQLVDQGSLGPLRLDEAPKEFRVALASVIDSAQHAPMAGSFFYGAFKSHCQQHFGVSDTWFPAIELVRTYPSDAVMSTVDVLDLVEILVEEATKGYSFVDRGTFQAFPGITHRLNRLFLRHRFGYRLEGGSIRRIGSPALDEAVVVPALQAVHRPGWEQVERTYREALHHQRGGPSERDDALTSANAALEAALKAAGLRGDRLSSLAKSLRNSDLVPGQLASVPEALDTLLRRSGAVRDEFSDAHGPAPDAPDVPQELADLSIYWTGAFINYLAAAADRRPQWRSS